MAFIAGMVPAASDTGQIGKVVSPCGVCLATGLARLSYGQVRMLLDEHTDLSGEPGHGLGFA